MILKTIQKSLIISTVTTGMLLSSLSMVFAQESRTITIVPPTVKADMSPRDKSEGIMKVINDSNDPISFTVGVQDFIVSDTKGTPNLLPPNTLTKKYSASAWIAVAPDSFTIKPHDTQMVNYYIQVPSDGSPGGHYAAVVFQPSNPPQSATGVGASVQSEIGTLFYVSVKGTINEFAQVTQFHATGLQEAGPITINSQIKNLSDIHITPSGYITITNMLGKNVAQLPLSTYNIFPSTARDYENTFANDFMLGRYKATLLASYGVNNNLPLTATLYFWVFPWKMAAVILLVLIALLLSIVVWRFNKGSKTQPQPEEEKVNPQ